MEAGNITVATCMLKQIEHGQGLQQMSTVDLYLDKNKFEGNDDFFLDPALRKIFGSKESSSNTFSTSKISTSAFLGILSSMKGMGWSMIGSNAYVGKEESVVKCFYFEKQVPAGGLRPPTPQSSPSRAPPVPARRPSRNAASMVADALVAVNGIAAQTSPAKTTPVKPAPPAPKPPADTPPKTPVEAPPRPPAGHEAERLGGLTRDRVTIETGKRTKPAGKAPKLLLQKLADDVEPKIKEVAPAVLVDDMESSREAEEKPPPAPVKPSDFKNSISKQDSSELGGVKKGTPSAFMQTLTSNPGGVPKRKNSIRSPPGALKTALTADDMQDTPYLTPAVTAPASTTQSSHNSFSTSPRMLRAPPPIPKTPDKTPSHFTFDDVSTGQGSVDDSDIVFRKPSLVQSESGDGVSASPAKKTVGVGSTYRSMLKSFQAKSKGSTENSTTPASKAPPTSSGAAIPPPPPPRASITAAHLLHSSSMQEAPKDAAPPAVLPRAVSMANDRSVEEEVMEKLHPSSSSTTQNFPDEKNIHFYERNLQFFKKLKEEEEKKKAAQKAKEDALPPDQLAQLQQKREQDDEREKSRTAHYQAVGRAFTAGGGVAPGRGGGIILTGRGGRGRGSSVPANPPPPPPV